MEATTGEIRWGWVAVAGVLVAIAAGLGYQEFLNSRTATDIHESAVGPAASPVRDHPVAPADTSHPATPPPKAARAARPRLPQPKATVEIRTVTDSRFRRAFRKLQPFGRKRDFVPPTPLHRVLPPVPSRLRNIAGETLVEVKLRVDSSGKVAQVQSLSHAADQRLQTLAVHSARQWKFSPARLNNRKVPSQVLLRFNFGGRQLAYNRLTGPR